MKEEITKRKNDISLFEIFMTFLKISSFTFGGGYTIIPVIRDEFVHKRGLVREEEMLDLMAIAQSGPGAMAISTSILTGYRIKGLKGALSAALGAITPCIVIISIISYFYKEFSHNKYIQYALKGMSGAISAILIFTTYDLYKMATKSNKIYGYIAIILAFSASMFTSIPTSLIILSLALSGLIIFGLKKDKKED